MKITQKQVKSVITKSKLPGADYVINPYTGCQHACIYCYADFIGKFTGHIGEKWGDYVDVKINAADTIKIKDYGKEVILISSVTDPYQPVEKRYKITQQILEKLLYSQPHLEILTKSALIRRDIELLKKFKNLRVGISLNSLDCEIARRLEPYAASPDGRIKTLKELSKAGIPAYIFISPIFPGITDYKKIIQATKAYADEYLFENLNIRANNIMRIMAFINQFFPELEELYRGLKTGSEYWTNLLEEITEFCNKKGIKHKIYFNHKKERTG